ncbi:unnamed protein product [Thlaspi arvense]|uniref:Clu domain-containing protein n=1 Tax=Thlaspi arvense TaxID=13288 RepID=A0AAU9T9J1_THLAR|nr:unnamed protein product [Thlaspi arvense]
MFLGSNKLLPYVCGPVGLSAGVASTFREILEQKASAHPFENVQSLLPPNSWLGLYPIRDHKRDAARAENALTLSFGSELIGMQRDWNEELQSCREFPHTTPQERILRDRALYKVTSDFVDAAINGAIGVISRCIPPINPTDPECFHMYVHNNIFFSFAVDADSEQLSRKHQTDTSSKTESTGSSLNSSDKKSLHGAAKVSSGAKSNGLSAEYLDSGMDLSSEVPAETQMVESEQATYASANNDLKGTKAYQEADVPGLYNLAMAIIDYRGHRVVAQSVLPASFKLFSLKTMGMVLEAAKRLHLKEHTVFDGSGNVYKLAAPVECKGIVGSDDRHYLLDLMRVTPRDANYNGPGSRFFILRPELISAFCQAKVAERSKSSGQQEEDLPGADDSPNTDSAEEKVPSNANAVPASLDTQDVESHAKHEAVHECGSGPAGNGEVYEEISFNPNVFTEFKLAGSEEEIAADEDDVRKASLYLKDVVLPKFIQDLCTLEVSPMDGQTLTDALHAHGINVRYIGKVAEGTKHLPHLWDLFSNEIVVRSAKHILKDVLRDSEDHDLAPTVSHFFNCFFGNCQAVAMKGSSNSIQSRTQRKDHSGHQASGKSSRGQGRKDGGSARMKQSSYLSITSDSLWSDLLEFTRIKYQFELPEDARSRECKGTNYSSSISGSIITLSWQKVGITIAARKYDLDVMAPFQTSDILNLQPVVKHSIPVCSAAKDLVETGKVQLAEMKSKLINSGDEYCLGLGKNEIRHFLNSSDSFEQGLIMRGLLSEAYALFSEAFTILQQVTGPMHREVANCCRYLAMVLYHAGDMAGAIMQQHKELIINERCLGLDHPDTAHRQEFFTFIFFILLGVSTLLCLVKVTGNVKSF